MALRKYAQLQHFLEIFYHIVPAFSDTLCQIFDLSIDAVVAQLEIALRPLQTPLLTDAEPNHSIEPE